ncbi:hypothetical protein PFISCL1PPCAC_8925, partial [Pristionchus fissidentatus]
FAALQYVPRTSPSRSSGRSHDPATALARPAPWRCCRPAVGRDEEEDRWTGGRGAGGRLHEGHAAAARLRLLQERQAGARLPRRRLLRPQRAGGRGAARGRQAVLGVADDSPGVREGRVCRWLRHHDSDAQGRRAVRPLRQARNSQQVWRLQEEAVRLRPPFEATSHFETPPLLESL